MSNKFMHGSPILLGDNTVPGVQLSKELKEYIPKILQACRDYGLDFYPTVVQLLTYDEISEIAAYGGFPVRFPHWSFGMEYEELQRGYEYGMHKIYEMVVNCLHPETKIITSSGTKNANSVEVGDTVFAGEGKARRVVAVVKQPKQSTLRIKIKGFGEDIICSQNHKWRVMTENGLVWKETKNLNPSDLLVGADTFDTYQQKPAKIDWDKNSSIQQALATSCKALKDISPESEMTLALAELLGTVVGSNLRGVPSKRNKISVVVNKKSPEYRRHVEKLMFEVFKTKPKVYKHYKSVDVVNMFSKLAVDFFENIGFTRESTHKSKRIPSIIWSSSNEYRAAFLRGLFNANGSLSSILSLRCFNHKLACDVQLLLREMGIDSKCSKRKNNNIVLKIRGRFDLQKFRDRIGFSLKDKQEALNEISKKRNNANRGIKIPFLQKKIIELAEQHGINSSHQSSLGRTLNILRQIDVRSDLLMDFLRRYKSKGFPIDDLYNEIYSLLSVPYFKVKKIQENDECETIDIALDHEEHDFIAAGILTHNTNPCYIYNLASNTLVDHLTVVAHATGHNDFFKNNVHFSATDTNMLNKMANHGTRIRKYMARWGKEKVTEFIDWVMRIQTLIDGSEAWSEKTAKNVIIRDERTYRHPRRLNVAKDHMYMDPFINTKEFKKRENEKVDQEDIADEIGIFREPTKNILAFLRDNAPLKPWQADIMSMIYDEAIYFFPQRQTKVLNEGFASFIDSVIMAEQGFVSLGQKNHDQGIVEYASHKMGVLGGKYSTNPYKLGFYLLQNIKERWDKGQFGTEWEECRDIHKKENWDTKTNLGKDKVFEVRKYYDDLTFIHEFFTEDFCRQQEYFHWKHYPNGEYRIETKDYKKIKGMLIKRHLNGGLPDIRLTEPNYRGKGVFMLQHYFDGRDLYHPYIADVLTAVRAIWGNDVFLATKQKDGKEMVYRCYGTNSEKDVETVTRKDHFKY